MSLSNEQLLYLSALVYYNIDKLETSNELDSIVSNIKKTGVTTCFDGVAGYTDKELGMDKIISFIENDSELMKLQMVLWQLRMKRSIENEKNVEKSKLINYTVKVKRDRGQTYRNVWTQSQESTGSYWGKKVVRIIIPKIVRLHNVFVMLFLF